MPNDRRTTVSQDLSAFQTSATYRALANSLPLSVLIKSLEGQRLFANDAYLKWRGVEWKDVAGKTDAELFPPEVARQYIEDDQRVMKSGKATHAVEPTDGTDGTVKWVERVKCPIRSGDGRLLGVQVLFWDVTARVKAEQAMKFEQSLLNTLLASIPDSIYFKDTASRFIRVSRAMAMKFGRTSAAEVHGCTDADIFSKEHAEQARRDELEIIATGVPLVDRVEEETWTDQSSTWCMTTKMPLKNADGDTIGTFGISRDITDLKRSEAALKEAVRMADSANRAKSEFLANMSHEIRTPMNAIIGMADLLSHTELNEEQSEQVDTIRRSSDALLRLLNDILDFSKIEARRLELESVTFSLAGEIQAAISTLRLLASEKNVSLKLEAETGLPTHFTGDPGRLRQVLVNLIGNAVKFTDDGSVTVVVEHRAASSAGSTNLADPNDLANLTDAADPISDDNLEDTYIDLDADQETFSIETALDESGEPSDVALELDADTNFDLLAAPENSIASDPDTTSNQPAPDAPLPLVKPNPGSTMSLRISVRDTGIGIPKSQQAAVLAPFTQADASMTRRFGGTGLGLSISRQLVELMGGTLKLESELGIGTTFYFDIDLPVASPPETSESDSDAEEDLGQADNEVRIPLCVLVAEDGITNQHVISGLLRSLGHECSIASDGRETLVKWRSESFDVILMDMHMPVMDGLEATRVIRQEEQDTKQHIPIVALTAAAMAEDAKACREAGMDEFLTKPIHRKKLEQVLKRIASELAESMDPLVDTPRDSSASGDASGILNLSDAHHDCLDLAAARSRIPGGASGVLRLATVFRGECESLVAQLSQTMPAGDADVARRQAHTLRGACGLLGAKQLQEVASGIEDLCRAGNLSDTTQAEKLLSRLLAESNRVITAIDELLEE
ncbi:PAS domain-containing protein [Neorhodopirellula lusitana]|uniref:PAS domain-containing protein n=1 Tax=Neorhodopirellula lusitana TaxID=445327 RepID=UPI0024B67219|nr:PAS domain-containing protein [Neorhodopirellula lusitana]